MMMNYYILN